MTCLEVGDDDDVLTSMTKLHRRSGPLLVSLATELGGQVTFLFCFYGSEFIELILGDLMNKLAVLRSPLRRPIFVIKKSSVFI